MAAECEAMHISAEEVIESDETDEFHRASKPAKVGTSGEDGRLGSSMISNLQAVSP